MYVQVDEEKKNWQTKQLKKKRIKKKEKVTDVDETHVQVYMDIFVH